MIFRGFLSLNIRGGSFEQSRRRMLLLALVVTGVFPGGRFQRLEDAR